MTLREIIKTIEHYAGLYTNANYIVESGNIYDISKNNYEMKFPAFCCSQEPPHTYRGEMIQYSFVLLFTDRLTNNRSNTIEVESTAIDVLAKTISALSKLSMIDIEYDTDINTFTERFSEECAGAYINIKVTTTLDSICEEVIKKLGEFAPEEFSDAFFKYIETL
jgi:hypothetical protein